MAEGGLKPFVSVALAPDSADAEVYGVEVSDLQSNISVGSGAISGTSKKISDGTVWDSGTWSEDESTGNYLALKAVGIPDGATATVEIVGGVNGPVTLLEEEDYMVVCRITSTAQKIKLVTTLNGVADQKTYTLNKLVLANS